MSTAPPVAHLASGNCERALDLLTELASRDDLADSICYPSTLPGLVRCALAAAADAPLREARALFSEKMGLGSASRTATL